jgi:hypothetical protein
MQATSAPLNARELRARQVVLAAGTLDAWQAKFEKYGTTLADCNCMDHQIRGGKVGFCKHMIAFRLLAERKS